MAVMIPRSKALAAASKKIRILGDKALNSNLDAFGFSRADCYRQGVEEAQNEIVNRLAALRTTSNPKGSLNEAAPVLGVEAGMRLERPCADRWHQGQLQRKSRPMRGLRALL